jgi:hypothetical protein
MSGVANVLSITAGTPAAFAAVRICGSSATPSIGLVGDSSHSRSVPGRLASTASVVVTSTGLSLTRPLPSSFWSSFRVPR